MPLCYAFYISAVRIGIWKIEEEEEALLRHLPSPSKYMEKLSDMKSDARRKEWLAVRVLLYTLLGEEKEIAYAPSGKPFLADGSWHISISHTQGYAAVALGSLVPVGVDIERFDKRVSRVAGRFMSAGEKAGPYEGDDTWGLLLHWSAKETLYKLTDGAGVDLRLVSIPPFDVQPGGSFEATEHWTPRQRTYTVSYQLWPDFVLTWAICPPEE